MAQRAARPARKPPDQYHHGDLRRALLQAAVRTIQRHGVHGLTLRAVGDDLGVSRSALYRHFTDKRALLTAVAAQGFRTLHASLGEAWQGAGKGAGGLRAMGMAYVRFAIDNPLHYRLMFGGGVACDPSDPDLEREGAGAFQVLVDAVIEEQRAGRVRQDDALALARFLWAQVHGIAMLEIDGPFREKGVDIDAFTRFALQRVAAGIAPDAPAPDRSPPPDAHVTRAG